MTVSECKVSPFHHCLEMRFYRGNRGTQVIAPREQETPPCKTRAAWGSAEWTRVAMLIKHRLVKLTDCVVVLLMSTLHLIPRYDTELLSHPSPWHRALVTAHKQVEIFMTPWLLEKALCAPLPPPILSSVIWQEAETVQCLLIFSLLLHLLLAAFLQTSFCK